MGRYYGHTNQANRDNPMPYTIVVYYYKDKASLEAGTPCKKAASGFSGLTLKEAITCKAKMPEEKVCGMHRVNMIEAEGSPAGEMLSSKQT